MFSLVVCFKGDLNAAWSFLIPGNWAEQSKIFLFFLVYREYEYFWCFRKLPVCRPSSLLEIRCLELEYPETEMVYGTKCFCPLLQSLIWWCIIYKSEHAWGSSERLICVQHINLYIVYVFVSHFPLCSSTDRTTRHRLYLLFFSLKNKKGIKSAVIYTFPCPNVYRVINTEFYAIFFLY